MKLTPSLRFPGSPFAPVATQARQPLPGRQASIVGAPLVLFVVGLFLTGCAMPPPAASPDATSSNHPTLDDFWEGRATFVLEVADTGLPMGESDTILLADGRLWSYIHASDQSAGVVDQCGDPVPFPGCIVLLESIDQGRSFAPHPASVRADATGLQCLMPCRQCPCTSQGDHIDQQQYPRVVTDGDGVWWMIYEYRGSNFLTQATDGVNWSPPREVPWTGVWQRWLRPCRPEEAIGPHPHAPAQYDCLVGAPPGLYFQETEADGRELYAFVGLGQNPSSMGCYRGPADGPPAALRKCAGNPLFTGALTYGPPDLEGPEANPYFDFRTISSADILRVGGRYYMFFEGVRGPNAGAAGDTQFVLGLARTTTNALDGPWELYPGNPILVDLPGNVGVGHADVLVIDGETILFTTLDGELRSRLVLRPRTE